MSPDKRWRCNRRRRCRWRCWWRRRRRSCTTSGMPAWTSPSRRTAGTWPDWRMRRCSRTPASRTPHTRSGTPPRFPPQLSAQPGTAGSGRPRTRSTRTRPSRTLPPLAGCTRQQGWRRRSPCRSWAPRGWTLPAWWEGPHQPRRIRPGLSRSPRSSTSRGRPGRICTRFGPRSGRTSQWGPVGSGPGWAGARNRLGSVVGCRRWLVYRARLWCRICWQMWMWWS